MLAFLICLIICFLLIKKLAFFELSGFSKTYLYFAFGVKLIAGFSLWLIYTYYYHERNNADIYKYFDDAVYLLKATEGDLFLRWSILLGFFERTETINSLIENTLYWDKSNVILINDNRILIRIHLFLLHFSNGFYHLHTLFFAFISFLGSVGLYRFFEKFIQVNKWVLLLSIFFIPSFVFWTSAPLKESWLIFGLGLFFYGVAKTTDGVNWKALMALFVGLISLISLKVYILFALLPALLGLLLIRHVSFSKWLILFFTIHLGLLLLAFESSLIENLSNQQSNFKALVEKNGASSEIFIPSFNTILDAAFATPKALYNVYIGPAFPKNLNPFSFLAAIEHFFFLSIVLLPILFFKKITMKQLALVLCLCSFLVLAGSIIGLTTPVWGAIVRYKTPLIPFYIIVVFTFVDIKRLFKIFKQ